MVELGKYAGTVLSAYGISLALLAGLVVQSVAQARRTKRRLDAAEARRAHARRTGHGEDRSDNRG